MPMISIEKAGRIEDSIHHDLMAELQVFASQCPSAGGVLHLGATSMDIEDNAEVMRIRESLSLLQRKLTKLLLKLAEKIELYASLPVMAFTHLQPAEPTTMGYRYACYSQDLVDVYKRLSYTIADIRGKGFKGAVGTSASYVELLGLTSSMISNELYPRI